MRPEGPADTPVATDEGRVLYLSYDGMTDPLGESQVIPYLDGLSRRGYDITLVSFEKPERSDAQGRIRELTSASGISWHPEQYTRRPPLLSTLWDVWRMWKAASRLHAERPFALVHCRSYIAALVGRRMQRTLAVRFVFDMRGFWADERVEGRLWDLSNPVFRAAYRFFKRREQQFLEHADGIVSLTNAGLRVMRGMPAGPRMAEVAVIPCSVDFGLFRPVSPIARAAARATLGIAPATRVVMYVGSIGTWYMLDEMLEFYRTYRARHADSVLVVFTREDPRLVRAAMESASLPLETVIVRAVSRRELAALLPAAEFGLFFIRPTFSKLASSPTKLGEYLAAGVPVVTNAGVGDVSEILERTGGGVVVNDFSQASFERAISEIDLLVARNDGGRIRVAAEEFFSLDRAVDAYARVYARALAGQRPSPVTA
jgi:glycosyltransferase involved in cell wall biosynthesis